MHKSFSIQIPKSHDMWQWCDTICEKGKRLYNFGIYKFRQKWINEHKILSFKELYEEMKTCDDYNCFGQQCISQQVTRDIQEITQSFTQSLKSYKKSPDSFQSRPKLPKYKDKIKGRFQVCFVLSGTAQPVNKWYKRDRVIKFNGLHKNEIFLPKRLDDKTIKEILIVPNTNCYEIVFNYIEEIETKPNLDINKVASIDLGLNNLCALTFGEKYKNPLLINGKHLKSINQYFNKKRSRLQSLLPKNQFSSNQIKRLTRKRNNKINNELHVISRKIIDKLIDNNIGILVIGNNKGWKQNTNLGNRNNQNFVSIPYNKLIQQLTYKFEEYGGKIIIQEESYTSKASFLDLDPIPTYSNNQKCDYTFSGKRVKRGLYKSKNRILLNADINASYNIMRKAVPDIFIDGIEGVGLHPEWLK